MIGNASGRRIEKLTKRSRLVSTTCGPRCVAPVYRSYDTEFTDVFINVRRVSMSRFIIVKKQHSSDTLVPMRNIGVPCYTTDKI